MSVICICFGVVRFSAFLMEINAPFSDAILFFTNLIKKMAYLCIFGMVVIGLWAAYACQYIQQFLDEED